MPPQFWALDTSKEIRGNAQLQLKLEAPKEFESDLTIDLLCVFHRIISGLAGTDFVYLSAGNFHIWYRESGTPIHQFRAHDVQAGHGSPCSTWCPTPGVRAAFATGNEGELKLWAFNSLTGHFEKSHTAPGLNGVVESPCNEAWTLLVGWFCVSILCCHDLDSIQNGLEVSTLSMPPTRTRTHIYPYDPRLTRRSPGFCYSC